MTDALIWGASDGIGQALTKQLIQDDWRVFAAARDKSKTPEGVNGRYSFDATSLPAIKDIAIDLARQTKGIDLWVYSAGNLHADLLEKMPPDDWQDVINVNLNGAFTTISHTLQLLQERGQATFIGAYIDHLILPKLGVYAAAKAGLETLVDVLQKENRKINFTLVKPGAVNTPFWQNVPFKMPKDAKQPDVVTQAILDQYRQGGRGKLNL